MEQEEFERIPGKKVERAGEEKEGAEDERRGAKTGGADLVGDDSSESRDDMSMVDVADVREKVFADEAHEVGCSQAVFRYQLILLPHVARHRRLPSRSLACCREARKTLQLLLEVTCAPSPPPRFLRLLLLSSSPPPRLLQLLPFHPSPVPELQWRRCQTGQVTASWPATCWGRSLPRGSKFPHTRRVSETCAGRTVEEETCKSIATCIAHPTSACSSPSFPSTLPSSSFCVSWPVSPCSPGSSSSLGAGARAFFASWYSLSAFSISCFSFSAMALMHTKSEMEEAVKQHREVRRKGRGEVWGGEAANTTAEGEDDC